MGNVRTGALAIVIASVLLGQGEAAGLRSKLIKGGVCAVLLAAGVLGSDRYVAHLDRSQSEAFKVRSPDKYWRSEPRISNGKLSSRWHLEYIGADLVDEEVSLTKKVGFAIWDEPLMPGQFAHFRSKNASSIARYYTPTQGNEKGHHGALVANLIAGPRTGATSIGELRHALGFSTQAYEWIALASDDETKLLNISFLLTRPMTDHPQERELIEQRKRLLEALVKDGVIPVIGIGNQAFQGWMRPLYRRTFPRIQNTNQNLSGILVGSLHPHGFPSKFNASGDDITVLAPGDSAILSSEDAENSSTQFFFGTSAVTGVVTGSLLPVYTHLHHIELEEWKIILRQTSLQVGGASTLSSTNPPGLLNAYKVWRVALRLKAQGWNETSVQDRRWLIDEDSRIYDFESESQLIEETLVKADQNAEDTYDHLRRAFLLSPTKERASRLETFCREHGLLDHVKFYESLRRQL